MVDREKLKALKARFEELKNCWERRVFGTISEEDVDAVLELIREAEPHVLTLEEVEASEEMVWVEFNSTHDNKLALEYVKVRRTENFPNSFTLTTDSGIAWIRDRGDYNTGVWYGMNSGWRCWTARPTVRQRMEVKWDAEVH